MTFPQSYVKPDLTDKSLFTSLKLLLDWSDETESLGGCMSQVELKPLSEQEITDQGFQDGDLWMIKTQEIVSGPFSTHLVNSYFNQRKDLIDQSQVRALDENDWQEVETHPKLKVKRPKLVPADIITKDTKYYLLIEGQRKGPFEQDAIRKMLHGNKIHAFDIVSDDEGMSWKKLAHFTFFFSTLEQKSLPSDYHFDDDIDGVFVAPKELHKEVQNLAGIVHLTQYREQKKLILDQVQLPEQTAFKRNNKIQYAVISCVALASFIGMMTWSSDSEKINVAEETELNSPTSENYKRGKIVKANKYQDRVPAQQNPKIQNDHLSHLRPSAPQTNNYRPTPAPQIQEYRETHDDFFNQERADVYDQNTEVEQNTVVEEGMEPNISRQSASEAPVIEEASQPVEEVGDF